MRIALISEHASPLAAIAGVDAGGQNQHVAELAAAVSRLGHEVTVYTRRDHDSLPEKVDSGLGFDVVHVPAGPAVPLAKDDLLPYMRPFGEWLRERWQDTERPDVVHAHFWMSGIAAVVAATPHGVPTVLTYHALGAVKRRYQQAADTSPAVRVRVERQLGLAVDGVIAQCPDEVDELVALGVPAERLTIVPSGVDVWRFSPDGPAAERSGRKRVLTAGRMVERKGYEDLIFAVRALRDVELVIAGGPDGDLHEDPEARRLMELARELGIRHRVRMVGAVPAAEMPNWYRSADVVACTPWYEPFGLTPLESMACGVPVVTYAIGGLKSSVLDGVTGAHVAPGDIGGLITALSNLLGDDECRQRLGFAARMRAITCYDWDVNAARVADVYQRLKRRRPAPARPAPVLAGLAPADRIAS
jgi:D-inositol-3-phosphate glycosyltransferase